MHLQLADRLNAAVRDEIMRLKTLNLSQLFFLPPSADEQLTFDEHPIAITIWHDVLESGEHRFVAQAGQKTLFGLATYLCADGFAVSETGDVRGLSDEELASFR